jgi:hypothetical protein
MKAAAVCRDLGGGVVQSLRWVMLMAMLVVIRFLSCRCCTLLSITLLHLTVVDDVDSPLGATLRFFLVVCKGDPMGTNGGAAMRAYPQRFNLYLCPVLITCLWLLVVRPYIEQAYESECARLRTTTEGKRMNPTQISARALGNLYLFPHVSASGDLDFLRPMEHNAASAYLAELRVEAGFGDRAFTWHGVVSGS